MSEPSIQQTVRRLGDAWRLCSAEGNDATAVYTLGHSELGQVLIAANAGLSGTILTCGRRHCWGHHERFTNEVTDVERRRCIHCGYEQTREWRDVR